LASINVTSFSVLLYRLYFAPKAVAARIVNQWPSVQRPLNLFKTVIRRCVLPKTRVWLQVQKGVSQGMWMRLGLPDEARYWRGEHEVEVGRALSAAIYQGAVVYDVGAHLGYFALGAARLVGKSGRVVAFDGDPDNVVRLRENALKNDLKERLDVIHAAVWSRTESHGIPFRRGVEPRAQGGVEADGCRPVLGSGELINVPVLALDGFIARGGPRPNLIKIDVEGGEYEVLLGSSQLFSKDRPLLIAEVHHAQAVEQIDQWLEAYRYHARWNASDGPRQLLAWPAEYDGHAWMQRLEAEPVPGQLT
jgi:FkbM family methyltransferase